MRDAHTLAAASMVTSGAITNRIDRMIAKGLVARTVDPDSRRNVIITLTPAGRRLIDKALVEHVANEKTLLTGLSGREQGQLAMLLRRLLLELEPDA